MPTAGRSSSSNNKKKKKNRQGKDAAVHQHRHEELIRAADHALLAEDAGQAMRMYTAAAAAIEKQQKQRSRDGDSDDGGEDVCAAALVSVLEKRAQAKLSLSDQGGALNDYRKALILLEQRHPSPLSSPPATTAAATTSETSSPTASATDEDDADLLDQKAGLCLYVGQLSEGGDALEAYKRGIAYLQGALSQRRRQQHQQQQGSDDIRPAISPDQEVTTDEEMIVDDDGEVSNRINNDNTDETPLTTESAVRETRRKLAEAYCTVAELFLTDLCYEENAEQECESYVTQALQITDCAGVEQQEPIVDALQAAANLRLSQKRGPEAVEYALRAYDAMKVGCGALATLVGMQSDGGDDGNNGDNAPGVAANTGRANELQELDSVQNLPGFEFRCQTAKVLLECAATVAGGEDPRRNQCVQGAVQVLASLLAENDEVVEIWYLMGEAFTAMHPPQDKNRELAVYYFQRCKEMLGSVQESLEQEVGEAVDEDEEDAAQRQLDEVMCQLDDVNAKLDELQQGAI